MFFQHTLHLCPLELCSLTKTKARLLQLLTALQKIERYHEQSCQLLRSALTARSLLSGRPHQGKAGLTLQININRLPNPQLSLQDPRNSVSWAERVSL